MVNERNQRLKIHVCLICNKICRGTEWRKHKAVAGHNSSWRRQFCSVHTPVEHAHIRSVAFARQHAACDGQKFVSNSLFRKAILETKADCGNRHNLSPAEDSDFSESEAEEEETVDAFILGEETESEEAMAVLAIQGAFSSDEEMTVAKKGEEKRVAAEREEKADEEEERGVDLDEDEERKEEKSMADGEMVRLRREVDARKADLTEVRNEERKVEKKEERKEEAKKMEKNEEKKAEKKMERYEEKKAAEKKTEKKEVKKGIKAQSSAWLKDERKAKVSQAESFALFRSKYNSLKAAHDTLSEENNNLLRQVRQTRLLTEEVELVRQQLRAKTLEVGKKDATIETLSQRLEFSNKSLNQEREKVAALEKELAEEKRKSEEKEREVLRKELASEVDNSQLLMLHVPVAQNTLCDQPLIFDMEAEEEECYEGNSSHLHCLHIKVKRRARSYQVLPNKKRRRICHLNGPEPQRPRLE